MLRGSRTSRQPRNQTTASAHTRGHKWTAIPAVAVVIAAAGTDYAGSGTAGKHWSVCVALRWEKTDG